MEVLVVINMFIAFVTAFQMPYFSYYQEQKFTVANQRREPLPNKNKIVRPYPLRFAINEMTTKPVFNIKKKSLKNKLSNKQLNNKKLTPLKEGEFCRRSFDGRSGYCISAQNCLHVMNEYRKHGVPIDICTYSRRIKVVCCPLEEKAQKFHRISAEKCIEHNDERAKGLDFGIDRIFSGKACVASTPMIVGGQVTHKEEYPHMAAVGWTQWEGKINWDCGGTLINDFFILTAAHCVTSYDKPPDIVRLGAQNLQVITPETQDIKIVIIILHPKYRTATYYHDIALLKLKRRAEFSALVRPACLWQLADLKVPNAIATGWGSTDNFATRSAVLRKVDLNIIDFQQCKSFYNKERRLPNGIMEGQFCAGHLDGDKDTCQGDSGGPLQVELPEYNCIKLIVGITSFGRFCGASNSPGVYTNISHYLDWIERNAFYRRNFYKNSSTLVLEPQ